MGFCAVMASVSLLASFGIRRMEMLDVYVETKTGLEIITGEEVRPRTGVTKEAV